MEIFGLELVIAGVVGFSVVILVGKLNEIINHLQSDPSQAGSERR